MDTVINKLWEIEEAAGAIADEANVRKKGSAKEMEDKTASFDAGLEQETAHRIADIGHKMEADMEAMLARQKSDFETLLKLSLIHIFAHSPADCGSLIKVGVTDKSYIITSYIITDGYGKFNGKWIFYAGF